MRIRTSLLVTFVLVVVGCHQAPDPADANLAPVDQNAPAQQYPPANQYPQPYQRAGGYRYQEPAPAYADAPVCPPGEDCDEEYVEAPGPPPPLPVYDQPPCPGPDYLWTPGYWDYSDAGYYWVPGVWVMAPYIDALWTPSYWEFYGGRYRRHRGYWGRHIGFYGGIHYGFGYNGMGYHGGYWSQGVFVYNREVSNVDPKIVRYVYSHSVANATPRNRISYYVSGGITRPPAPAELAVRSETRIAPLRVQVDHARAAAADRSLFAAENRGRPPVAALPQALPTAYRAPAPAPRSWQREQARQNVPAANAPQPAAPPAGARAPAQPAPQAPQANTRAVMPSRPAQPPAPPGQSGPPAMPAAPRARQEVHPAPRQMVQVSPQAHRASAPQTQPRQMVQAPAQSRPAPPPRQPRQMAPAPPQSPPTPFAAKPSPPPRQMVQPAPQARPAPPPQQARPESQRQVVQAPPQPHPAPPPAPARSQEARPAPPQQSPPTPPPGRGSPPPEKGHPRKDGRGGQY